MTVQFANLFQLTSLELYPLKKKEKKKKKTHPQGHTTIDLRVYFALHKGFSGFNAQFTIQETANLKQ